MKSSSLKDKVVIITGSSRGIGKAIALAMANKGARVVINGRNAKKLEAARQALLAQGHSVLAVSADVGNYADCQLLVAQVVSTYGQIDVLINNAGISMEGAIADTEPKVFERVLHTNIMGVLLPTKAALAYLKNSKGSIVFTGSIAGYMGLPNYSAYSASKMALTALVQSLKIELAGTGVHVGINYVGFAENEKDKTYYDARGNLQKMPVRKQFKRMPMEQVAYYFVKSIEHKTYKQTLSTIGKFTRFMQQYFPALFEWLMIRKWKQQQKLKHTDNV